MMFDTLLFADYSGSQNVATQRRSIAVALARKGADGRFEPPRACSGLDRTQLRDFVDALLAQEWAAGRRVLFGFDHQYAFPLSFTRALAEAMEDTPDWEFQLELLAKGHEVLDVPGIREQDGARARDFASRLNVWAQRRWGTNIFWGPNFASQPTAPGFPFERHGLHPLRTVEQRLAGRAKSIFQIGGQGTVGLQSLSGIPHLRALQGGCTHRYRIHAWPFSGFEIAPDTHVMVEVYPSLHNRGARTDTEDALETVRWAARMLEQERLESFLNPDSLTEAEREVALSEGWILGVV